MDMSRYTTFFVVLIGWVFSLCLHEFSHALVAYYGGDYTVKDKGYLTFNPLKYTHPLFSIALPLLFLVMGGIGLPGGAVYIETWRLRSKNWMTAVSLAGPSANLVVAIVLALVLRFAPISADGVWPGLAFLALLQVTAVIFNLIPLPPFDGYGAIRPHLDPDMRDRLDAFGQVSMLIVFAALWLVPVVGAGFWGLIYSVTGWMGIPPDLADLGYQLFRFWATG